MSSTKFILFLSLFLLAAFGQTLQAQTYYLSNRVPVYESGDSLFAAWGGGMNSPQFSSIDLNLDGYPDVAVFDRDGECFAPYLNLGTAGQVNYTFAPEYMHVFDSCECYGWASFVDFTCDGKPDLLCGSQVSGVWGYKQVVYSMDSIGFVPVYKSLKSKYGINFIDLYAARIDFPGIIDADNDGDLDFFTFGNFTNYVEFHENIAMDSLGRCDTIILNRKSFCWGHFFEDNVDNTAHLFDTVLCALGDFDPPGRPAHGGTQGNPVAGQRHTGSTLLLLDLDADSVKDILIGDVSFAEVYALHNAGNLHYAYMDSVLLDFPAYDIPIDLEWFPALFYLDVDNDGIKDLVAAPNLSSSSENFNGVQWYKNIGQNNLPDLRYQANDFLQGENLDFGSNAAPVFVDFDQDGLMDLVTGSFGYYNRDWNRYQPGLAFLKNTGTAERPEFTLMDRDFLGIQDTLQYPNLLGIAPFFADMDGDMDLDMLMGNAVGTVYYFENTAGPGNPVSLQFVTNKYMGMDVGNFSAPSAYDIDGDSDLDLFVGNQRGRIVFYKNTGTATVASFDSITAKWGAIQIDDGTMNPFAQGHSKPLFLDYNDDGKMDLLVGGVTGEVEIFSDLTSSATDTFPHVGTLYGFRFSGYAAPAAARLDTSDHYYYVVGTQKGGLQLLYSPLGDDTTMVSVDPRNIPLNVKIYPNPNDGSFFVEWPSEKYPGTAEISLFNPMGQLIRSEAGQQGRIRIEAGSLSTGIYYLKLRVAGREYSGKVLIR